MIGSLVLSLIVKMILFFQIIVYILLLCNLLININYQKFIRIINKSADQFLGYFKFEIRNLLLYNFLILNCKLIQFDNKIVQRDFSHFVFIIIHINFSGKIEDLILFV